MIHGSRVGDRRMQRALSRGSVFVEPAVVPDFCSTYRLHVTGGKYRRRWGCLCYERHGAWKRVASHQIWAIFCHRAGEAGIGERLRREEVIVRTTKLLPAPPMNHPQVRGSLGFSDPGSNGASGSPASRRRTFASGIPALRSLRAAGAFALRAALTGEAGSRNTGDPSPAGAHYGAGGC